MAWTETCKIDANKQIDHLVEQDMSITEAIKKLSAESEIPYGTIQRWYYPRNEGRTDPTATTTQNDEKKGAASPFLPVDFRVGGDREEIDKAYESVLKFVNHHMKGN